MYVRMMLPEISGDIPHHYVLKRDNKEDAATRWFPNRGVLERLKGALWGFLVNKPSYVYIQLLLSKRHCVYPLRSNKQCISTCNPYFWNILNHSLLTSTFASLQSSFLPLLVRYYVSLRIAATDSWWYSLKPEAENFFFAL